VGLELRQFLNYFKKYCKNKKSPKIGKDLQKIWGRVGFKTKFCLSIEGFLIGF
jgi:hypothetical protein